MQTIDCIGPYEYLFERPAREDSSDCVVDFLCCVVKAAIREFRLGGKAVIADNGALAGFDNCQQTNLTGRSHKPDTTLHAFLRLEDARLHQMPDHFGKVRGRFSEGFGQAAG